MLVAAAPHDVIERFAAACRADARIVAAFLGGSHARETADAHSDIDFGLITADEAHEQFLSEREAFIALLGEPLFLESFDSPHNLFFILADGTEGELAVGRESAFQHMHGGPYRVLHDPGAFLDGVSFPWAVVEAGEQRGELRRLVQWYWHDFSHVTTALGRGQLWWAYGQLESLRRSCIDLVRLRADFSAPLDTYDKLDKAVSADQLAPLADTFCPMEREAILAAVTTLTQFYRDLARPLAHEHGIPYPAALDEVMSRRFELLTADSR